MKNNGVARFFDKYYGILRKLKVNYVLANLFNGKDLEYNKSQYKKYGVNKSVFMPVSSEDFDRIPDEEPWLDKDFDQNKLEELLRNSHLPEEFKQGIREFPEKGYIVVKGFLSEEEVELANKSLEDLIESGEVGYNFTGRKVMFAFQKSKVLDSIVRKMEILETMQIIMNKVMHPFQTINFIEPSEQKAHSDTIHMTTHPLGYMMAAWFALEDIGEDQGPIFYYPGSHKFPYILNSTYDHGGNSIRIGENAYGRFETEVQKLVDQNHAKQELFLPKKGDVLIWHGNLLHGGSPWNNKALTRKSMVCHYFAEGVICYHDLTQRVAYIKKH